MRAERLPYFNFHEGSTRDLRSNVSAFRALGALKGELVLRVLAARRHVLLSDVDVIWLRDPRALLLDRALGAADVMVATDCLSPTDDDDKTPRPKGANRCAYGPANVHGHAAFNTGVLFFRATAAARVVAAAWRHRLLSEEKNKWLDDQVRNWRNSGAIRRNYCAILRRASGPRTTTARVQRARMVWLPAAPRRRRQGRRAQRSRDRDLDGRAAAARGGRRQG